MRSGTGRGGGRAYRQVLALAGVSPLLLVGLLARVPATMAGIVLTLHVVLDLERGYGAAGVVAAALTVGAALGAPLLGRLVDRRGLRLVLVIATCAEALFWTVAPILPYPLLVGAAFLGGLLALPVFSVVRQSLAALVPEGQRRQAYSLDSMSVELAFMIGPAAGVLLATTGSPRLAMLVVGAGYLLAGVALFRLNPPVRETDAPAAGTAPVPRREWLRPRLLALLALSTASTLVLAGTDVSVVAMLRSTGQVEWTGLVLALWAAYSMAGGFVYGAVPRALSPLTLVALLSVLTIPVGLAGDGWWWLALAMLPAGALCAPALAAAAEAVSRMVPAGARGEAMGLHASAMTVGLAIGAPLAGAVIDATSAGWGFAAVGTLGGLVALASAAAWPRHRAVAPEAEAASPRVPSPATPSSPAAPSPAPPYPPVPSPSS